MRDNPTTKTPRQHNLNSWTQKKRAALRVADRLEAAGYPDRAARMRQCSRILVTRSCPAGHTHRVVEAVLAGEAELGLIEGAEAAPRRIVMPDAWPTLASGKTDLPALARWLEGDG